MDIEARRAATRFLGLVTLKLVAALILFVSGRSLYRAITSHEWPTTVGTITESHVRSLYRPQNDDAVFSFIPHVRYEYSVDGKTYTGDRITYYGHPVITASLSHSYKSAYDETKQIVSQYPKGQSVKVYYYPTEPSLAILTPGFDAGRLMDPCLLAVLVILAIVLVVLSPARLNRLVEEN